MLTIDGSYLEGGGQIIRTALALSAITKTPITVTNIRKNRPKSGLAPQHLAGIEAAAQLCGAETKGAHLNSEEIEFYPKEIKGGVYQFDIKTAGAITLLLQTLVPIAVFAKTKTQLTLKGGTHVSWSPTYDYFDKVFCANLEKIGLKIERKLIKAGFYPKGGGEVKVTIHPSKIYSFNPKRTQINNVELVTAVSEGLRNVKVAERMCAGFRNNFRSCKIKENINYYKSACEGAVLTAIAYYDDAAIGATALGEIKKLAETVGKECAVALKKEIDSEADLDCEMADQILPFIAFADSDSEFKISQASKHLQTNIWVIEQFLKVKFNIKDLMVSCQV